MPPALVLLVVAGQVERVLWGPPADPPPGKIDTVLARGPVERTIDGAVTIERDHPAGAATDGDEDSDDDLTAPRGALAAVRDDTVFRSADGPAWFAIWKLLAEEAASGGAAPRGRAVTFAQLFEQPDAFRGRRVRFEGTIRRLQEVEAPANDIGLERTWQAWIEPAGGPPSPIVVYFLSVPPEVPVGMRVHVPVIVDGVFFKRWAYQATDAIRLAPLVMSAAPRFPPRITTGRGSSGIAGWALVSILALVAVTAGLLRGASAARPRRRLPETLPRFVVDSSPGDAEEIR